jgi:gliding motility-associated-like protein
MYLTRLELVLFLFFTMLISELYAQDTTPPSFSTFPRSDSAYCNNSNLINLATDWFNRNASAVASDNSGSVSIAKNKTLVVFLDSVRYFTSQRCLKNRRVSVSFIASDPSGNSSSPRTAYFKINDEEVIVTRQPDFLTISRSCTNNLEDSLAMWIKAAGNAQIQDACGGRARWTNYIFNTENGISGSGSIAQGPYPKISNLGCQFSINVSFFAQDSCGTSKTVTGRFLVKDDHPPVLDQSLVDLTVSCTLPIDTTIKVKDFCDAKPNIRYSVVTDRSNDATKCSFNNYIAVQTWRVTDACNNSSTFIRRLYISDLEPPVIDAASDLTISCNQKDSIQLLVRSVRDGCSTTSLSYKDSMFIDGCLTTVLRRYTAVDICNNMSQKVQRLAILDQAAPAIAKIPVGLFINCDTSGQRGYNSWLDTLGGLKATDDCSSVSFKYARDSSFNLKDPRTWKDNPPTFDELKTCKSDSSFFVIIHDRCGNAVSQKISFSLIDTSPPNVTCSSDTIRFITGKSCSMSTRLIIPKVLDNCNKDLIAQVSINGLAAFMVNDSTIDLKLLKSGINTINFSYRDCAGNITSCIKRYEVIDSSSLSTTISPTICPSDTFILNGGVKPDTSLRYQWKSEGKVISNSLNDRYVLPSSVKDSTDIEFIITDKQRCFLSKRFIAKRSQQAQPLISLIRVPSCIGDTAIIKIENLSNVTSYDWYISDTLKTNLLTTLDPNIYKFIMTSDSSALFSVAKTNNCLSKPSNKLVLKSSGPIINFNINDQYSFCHGDSIKLKIVRQIKDGSLVWISPKKDTLMGDSVVFKNLATPQDSGQYEVYIVKGNCRSASKKIKVSINPKLQKPNLNGKTIICFGEELKITARVSTKVDVFVWAQNGRVLHAVKDSVLTILKTDSTHAGRYLVYAQSGNCSSDSTSILVKTNPEIKININQNPKSACEGKAITLKADSLSGFTYFWQGPNNLSSINSSISSSISGTYTLLAKDSLGCEKIIEQNISFTQKPLIERFFTDFDPCRDTSIRFVLKSQVRQTPIDAVYKWILPNGLIISNSDSQLQNQTLLGSYQLVISSGLCSSDTARLIISGQSEALSVSISAPTSACDLDTIKITANTLADSVQFYIDGVLVQSSRSKSFNQLGINKDSIAVYARGFKSLCQSDTSNRLVIRRSSRPASPKIEGLAYICYADSLRLKISNPDTSLKYEWYTPSRGVFSGVKLSIIDLPDRLRGSYYARAKKGSCLSDTSNRISLNIKDRLLTPKLTVDQSFICDNGMTTINACLSNIPLDTSLTFIISEYPSEKILAQTRANCTAINARNLSANTKRIRLVSRKDECVSDAYDENLINLTKQPEVRAEIQAKSFAICNASDSVVLSNIIPIDTLQVIWNVFNRGNRSVNLPENKISIKNFLEGDNLVSLSISYLGCRNFANDTISIVLGKTPEANNDSLNFEDEKKNIPILINDSIGRYYSIKIDPVDQGIFKIDNGKIYFTPRLGFAGLIKTQYKVCFGECDNKCDTARLILTVLGNDNCIIPNIITPNNDGINDAFRIPCLGNDGWESVTLSIVDQWGNTRYQSFDYKNDWLADGLLDDTYYYVLKTSSGQRYTGYVIVKR